MSGLLVGATLGLLLAAEPPKTVTPYSLPFQLRPTVAATVVRSDNTFALSSAADGSAANTEVGFLLASYAVTETFSPFVRAGFIRHGTAAGEGLALTNPAFGALAVFPLSDGMRVAGTLGAVVPVGQGGGDDAPPPAAMAMRSGPLARGVMDSAMFTPNDVVVFPGVAWSLQLSGFTLQAEATVFALNRVRGERSQPDRSRTNFTSGLHVGYFVLPQLSVGGELRYQRWLSTPAAVANDATQRDCASAALGLRGLFKIKDGPVARPGLAVTRGLTGALAARNYLLVQLDLPFIF